MKVLMICFVYNEIKYLPHTIEYYKKNGCDVYVIDNMSTDGTWEWLQKNEIQSHRVDTGESFDLRILQKEIVNTLPKLKPDWVVYAGADLYYIARMPLADYIEKVESMGYNQLSMICWSAFNTGEKPGVPLPAHYYYALPWKHIVMISRYDQSYAMNGDNVSINNARCYEARHAMAINYGACKPIEEQKIKLQRRKKAWAAGMRKQQGKHFVKGEKCGWLRKKESLRDLRKLPEMTFINKISGNGSAEKFSIESYNRMYSDSTMYKRHYKDTVYFPVWNYIAERILNPLSASPSLPPGGEKIRQRSVRVLDLGCGPGQMAGLLYDAGIRNYTGIDFSGTALELARKNVPAFDFIEADLNAVDYTRFKDCLIISTETFEHLENDIALVKRFAGQRIIFSVPDFMCANHYRTYNSAEFIRQYYKGVLQISEIKPFSIGKRRYIFVVDGTVLL